MSNNPVPPAASDAQPMQQQQQNPAEAVAATSNAGSVPVVNAAAAAAAAAAVAAAASVSPAAPVIESNKQPPQSPPVNANPRDSTSVGNNGVPAATTTTNNNNASTPTPMDIDSGSSSSSSSSSAMNARMSVTPPPVTPPQSSSSSSSSTPSDAVPMHVDSTGNGKGASRKRARQTMMDASQDDVADRFLDDYEGVLKALPPDQAYKMMANARELLEEHANLKGIATKHSAQVRARDEKNMRVVAGMFAMTQAVLKEEDAQKIIDKYVPTITKGMTLEEFMEYAADDIQKSHACMETFAAGLNAKLISQQEQAARKQMRQQHSMAVPQDQKGQTANANNGNASNAPVPPAAAATATPATTAPTVAAAAIPASTPAQAPLAAAANASVTVAAGLVNGQTPNASAVPVPLAKPSATEKPQKPSSLLPEYAGPSAYPAAAAAAGAGAVLGQQAPAKPGTSTFAQAVSPPTTESYTHSKLVQGVHNLRNAYYERLSQARQVGAAVDLNSRQLKENQVVHSMSVSTGTQQPQGGAYSNAFYESWSQQFANGQTAGLPFAGKGVTAGLGMPLQQNHEMSVPAHGTFAGAAPPTYLQPTFPQAIPKSTDKQGTQSMDLSDDDDSFYGSMDRGYYEGTFHPGGRLYSTSYHPSS
jgi:hypothetical protein